jgi:hypothetical protein
MPLIIPANSITGGYEVDNSLRFNDDSSDYLSRTPAGASNRRTWTWSGWIKRANLGTTMTLFGTINEGTSQTTLNIYSSGSFGISSSGSGFANISIDTSALLRDVSAWYHLVVAVDTTQSTASNRVKIYINGTQETSLSSTTYPALNSEGTVNQALNTEIGRYNTVGFFQYFDGYMSEVNFIDGQALDPTSFGEFDSATGIWKPIDVSGLTFGTNGFYLDFENSGSLGADVSGNGNNFTVNNLTSIDQTTDTPTNNFATLNPLNSTENGTEPTYSEGNLQSVSPLSGGGFVGSSTIGVSTGKWFFELQRSAGTSTNVYIGIGDEKQTREIARQSASAVFIGNAVYYKPDDGNKVVVTNGSGVESSYGDTYGNGDIIGIALNMDNNEITFYKNGTAQNSGTAISIPTPDGACFLNIVNGADTSDTFKINFGSPPYTISSGNSDGNSIGNFEYAVPSGYLSLCTKNLATDG